MNPSEPFTPAPQRPSVGRVVHYVSHGTPIREDGTQAFSKECRAATITELHTPEAVPEEDYESIVGLSVQNPTGLFFHPLTAGGVPHDEDEKAGGTWHWPERV